LLKHKPSGDQLRVALRLGHHQSNASNQCERNDSSGNHARYSTDQNRRLSLPHLLEPCHCNCYDDNADNSSEDGKDEWLRVGQSATNKQETRDDDCQACSNLGHAGAHDRTCRGNCSRYRAHGFQLMY